MKKKGMSTHPGINDWSLSIDLLKIRTIEYLVPVPRIDMFLDLALKILLLYSLLEYIMVIHIWSDAYVVKDHLYLYAESLIQIEMYNDPVDKIFLFLKQKNMALSYSSWAFQKNINFFLRFLRWFSYVYKSFIIIWYETKKKKKWQNKLCISM